MVVCVHRVSHVPSDVDASSNTPEERAAVGPTTGVQSGRAAPFTKLPAAITALAPPLQSSRTVLVRRVQPSPAASEAESSDWPWSAHWDDTRYAAAPSVPPYRAAIC